MYYYLKNSHRSIIIRLCEEDGDEQQVVGGGGGGWGGWLGRASTLCNLGSAFSALYHSASQHFLELANKYFLLG